MSDDLHRPRRRSLLLGSQTWHWEQVDERGLDELWPLIVAVGHDESEGWHELSRDWLELCPAANGIAAVRTDNLAVAAAMLYSAAPGSGRLVVERLRRIELGMPGRTLEVALHVLVEIASGHRCRDIVIKSDASNEAGFNGTMRACASACGFFERDGAWLSRLAPELDRPRRQS